MDNVFEIPYKERGFCNCGEDLVRQVSSLRMGMFRRKGFSGPHESYDVVGYLMGGVLKTSLRGPRVCESLPIFDEAKQREVGRTKRKRSDF